MPRPRILSAAEREAFDNPPSFTAPERKKYIALSEAVRSLVDTLQTPTNRVCFLVTLAYFRATRKFFARQFHPRDVSYAARLLGVEEADIDVMRYAKSRAHHHRAMILEYTGWAPFDARARQLLTGHLRPLVRSHSRPKAMFVQAVDTLQRHKIEVPGAYGLTELILEAVRRHKQGLVEHIRAALPPESRAALDALSEKGPAAAEDLEVQRSRLALLKQFSHSTKPAKIKANVADLGTIGELYRPLHEVVRTLDLTPEGLRYYAHSVIKAEVFQVSRRAEPDRHLHLLCFIAHQYFHLHDLLMDTLLIAARGTAKACKQEDRDRYYDSRADRREAARSLVEHVERLACDPLDRIEAIAFRERLPDAEEVRRIQDVLRRRGEQRRALEQQIARFKDDLRRTAEERAYCDVLERKSVKLAAEPGGGHRSAGPLPGPGRPPPGRRAALPGQGGTRRPHRTHGLPRRRAQAAPDAGGRDVPGLVVQGPALPRGRRRPQVRGPARGGVLPLPLAGRLSDRPGGVATATGQVPGAGRPRRGRRLPGAPPEAGGRPGSPVRDHQPAHLIRSERAHHVHGRRRLPSADPQGG